MRRQILTLLCTVFAGCSHSPTGPDADALTRELPLPEGPVNTTGLAMTRSVGFVQSTGDGLPIEVPISVRRGQPLATAVTLSLGSCSGPDTTIVTVSGLTATVVPYVKQPTDLSAISCVAGYTPARVTSPVVFTQTGEARVRFVVRGATDFTLQVVERRVQVTE